MGKKDKRKKNPPVSSDAMTSRNWEHWRDDYTGADASKEKYDTPQDYLGSEDYHTNQPIQRANRVEQALIFMRKLADEHQLTIKTDGVVGEKILIVLDGTPDAKLKAALLKAYQAAGYGTVRIEIAWG